jgi:signal transduction histidine kinase
LPEIACFPAQLNQVFLNLLINAKQAIMGRPSLRGRGSTRGTAAQTAASAGAGAIADVEAVDTVSIAGTIIITTSLVDGRVWIDIADTGVGIPEKDLPRIFDPGFTTRGVGVGTGLGLSICYQIVRSHHGEIRVTSQLNEGTKVSVILPTDLDVQLAGG